MSQTPRVGAPVDGRLAPPPSSPNCVSSQADPSDAKHHIAALGWSGDPAQAQAHIKRTVLTMPGTRLEAEADGYLHFVFRSRVFRFKDDFELVLADGGLLHVRSASRVGYDDLGANRKRVEALRLALGG